MSSPGPLEPTSGRDPPPTPKTKPPPKAPEIVRKQKGLVPPDDHGATGTPPPLVSHVWRGVVHLFYMAGGRHWPGGGNHKCAVYGMVDLYA